MTKIQKERKQAKLWVRKVNLQAKRRGETKILKTEMFDSLPLSDLNYFNNLFVLAYNAGVEDTRSPKQLYNKAE